MREHSLNNIKHTDIRNNVATTEGKGAGVVAADEGNEEQVD